MRIGIIYIKCGKDEYRVVGYTLGEPTSIFSVPIASIVKKNENGEYLDSNLKNPLKNPVNKDVQEMLGLKDDVTTVKVDSISNEPFEGTALGRPKLNTTTTQQVVNNYTTITPSAVPNKSQGNSIVINGIVIPEGAKLKFFPEISDFLSRASLEREMLFCKVAPNSLFTQSIAEQAASNDHSR
ncbi:MAG: hypothetical protein O7157_03540 [Wolbachia endosymbiont of Tetragnatha montana]|nr:hypothetical protein [Wolbachia endosymbiont of Tetragnatha montana]